MSGPKWTPPPWARPNWTPPSRRTFLAAAAAGLGAAALGSVAHGDALQVPPPAPIPAPTGYAPDGTAGLTRAFPLNQVRLLPGPFTANAGRNTDYLMFLDADRLLRSFRVNYGLDPGARPCGGWEAPASLVRGHNTGHLMSALALTWAGTGNSDARDKGRYIVRALAALQGRAVAAGFNPGYLSAFPEQYFDRLEAGQPVWSPYYMIHKYLAGFIDMYQLAGDEAALAAAISLADWVGWRTGRLTYEHMQRVLEVEYGGLPESLANLYTITGNHQYLVTAERFYHAQVLDPLARGRDQLAGLQANVTVPKIIAFLRLWEETGDDRYHAIATNFWEMVIRHHTYVIGGVGDHEHFDAPGVVAAALSNYTCENCASYNLLKLTRLLHFHQQDRTDLLDYYERTLFNQMLGEQDPDSPHGFNIYYTGLSPGAFKQQPLNYFPHGDPDIYATNYDTFTCDTATGMETQAKLADTIYSRDDRGIYVNLFVPSTVTCTDRGITLRQTTGFPDQPQTRIEVASGLARMTLRVRIPAWTAARPRARLNGGPLPVTARAGGWLAVDRIWQPGDTLEVTLPMRLGLEPTPDQPAVQAATYGPVVLAGGYGTEAGTAMPALASGSLTRAAGDGIGFTARAGGRDVTLRPIARTQHQHYNVYWQTD
ncbi:MAG: glycoside hydrolase family 127 protein [Actinobacteria bacterium]|nr:glycoside hydrolase family 127 protein [Actinomycetota bacterium]